MRLAALGLMTAGISHDLHNLLQVVASAVHLIDRRLDERVRAELHPLTEGALTSVERAAALSRQILNLSSTESDSSEITFLGATVAAVRDLIVLTAGPDIAVELISGADVPAVICNARELENVILNLVINARDAMPDGGRLTLATYREGDMWDDGDPVLASGSQAVLRVSDNGCGMSADTRSQAFRPFFTTKPRARGTGLGLAMVSDFARRTGGSAEIESELGAGTAVTLRLPGCGA